MGWCSKDRLTFRLRMRYKYSSGATVLPTPPPGTASDPFAPGHAWIDFMASQSFDFGRASDQLIEICCPGMKPIAFTGRELPSQHGVRQ